MKKTLEKLEWIIDYYLVYFLYNPNKIDRYHEFMLNKWNLSIEPITLSKSYTEQEETFNGNADISGGLIAQNN